MSVLSFVISPNSQALRELLWLRLFILPTTDATVAASVLSFFLLKRAQILQFALKNSTMGISRTLPFPKLIYFNFNNTRLGVLKIGGKRKI